jgi:hypothetical protein
MKMTEGLGMRAISRGRNEVFPCGTIGMRTDSNGLPSQQEQHRFLLASKKRMVYASGALGSSPSLFSSFASFAFAVPASTSSQNWINAGKTVSFQYSSLRLTRTIE